MDIVKQVDAADIGIDDTRFVAFVEAETVEMPGPEPGDNPYPLDRYVASVHRRPVGQASFIESCGHQHRYPTTAITCAKRLLRKHIKVVDSA